MSADERRGFRFALLILALASAFGAVLSWAFLDGYNQAVTLLVCSIAWLGAVGGQLALMPRTHKRPRRTGGA